MNIVFRLARMLDTTGAYQEVVNIDQTPRKLTPEQKSWRNYYESLSHDILKIILSIKPISIKDDLMAYERERYRRAGFPFGKNKELDAKMEAIIKSHLGSQI